jgi:hypothetical protein
MSKCGNERNVANFRGVSQLSENGKGCSLKPYSELIHNNPAYGLTDRLHSVLLKLTVILVICDLIVNSDPVPNPLKKISF